VTHEQTIISDPSRHQPIVLARRDDSWVIHAPRATLFLSDDEAGRLVSALTGRAHIERYAVTTPAKARFHSDG
jgi:hypothetical protein